MTDEKPLDDGDDFEIDEFEDEHQWLDACASCGADVDDEDITCWFCGEDL